MRDVLLTIHILAAAGYIGGGAYSLFVLPGSVREMGLKTAMAKDQSLGNKFFGTTVGVLLLSGIGLILDSDVYGWGDTFVLIGIGVIVVSGIIEGVSLAPATKRLVEAGDESPATIKRFIWRHGSVPMVLIGFAFYVMVTKLGT